MRYAPVPTGGAQDIEWCLSRDLDVLLARRPDLRPVTLADGAPETQGILDRVVSNRVVAAQMVDFWHCAEHLGEAIAATGRYKDDTLHDWKVDLLERDEAIDDILVILRGWSMAYMLQPLPTPSTWRTSPTTVIATRALANLHAICTEPNRPMHHPPIRRPREVDVRWFVFGIVGVALAALAVVAVEHGWVALQDPSHARYPIRGLDVSHHQGPIDWPAVATDPGLRFVWIKATEGGDWTDPRFAENWTGARSAGLAVGAYHYFTLCRPGAEQAAHFLATAPSGPDTLPPALDVEHEGNCSARPATRDLLTEIDVFLGTVEATTGRRPVLYTTRAFHRRHLTGALRDHPLWIRDVVLAPGDIDGRPWTVWQHLSRGRVAGIDGFVDRNVFRGDADAFRRFAGR